MSFCHTIKICRDSRTFCKTLGKNVLFWGVGKTAFLGHEVHCTNTWYILYNAILQLCKFAITHKNDELVPKIANTRLTKILWPFCLRRKAANFFHLAGALALQGVHCARETMIFMQEW